jgi:hypothetical protein
MLDDGVMNSYFHACYSLEHARAVMAYSRSTLISLAIWIVHYLSAFLTVGSMVMIDLRVLGIAGRGQTITQVSKVYSSWLWVGLSVITITGLLLATSDATEFCTNGLFGFSLLVMVVAAISSVIITRKAAAWDALSEPPLAARLFTAFSLLLWFGAILSAVEVPSRSYIP